MAMSPAGVVVAPSPKAEHHHRILLALLAVALSVTFVTVLAEQLDDGSSSGPTPSRTTTTYQPAPPVNRLGPTEPDF